eukprot:scaffold300714_cov21-Tisochrysis_lutea.AAC.2
MGQGWRKRRREGGRGEAGINAGADVWQPPRQSYWTGEKVLLWGGMLLLRGTQPRRERLCPGG